MIAELLTTIIMALGVATGNVSSNSYKSGNAFNQVEKINKPSQRAVEQTNANFYLAQEYTQTLVHNNVGRDVSQQKYYLEKESNQNAVYETDIYNITNTTYSVCYDTTDTEADYMLITLIKITTYFNFTQESIVLTQTMRALNNAAQNMKVSYYRQTYETDSTMDAYIDMNLTSSTAQTLYDNVKNSNGNNPLPKTNRTAHYDLVSNAIRDWTSTETNSITITNLQASQTRYVVLATDLYIETYYINTITGWVRPTAIAFEGTSNITNVNYEVIDIPNLMFTVLTMPFSFISTAFNLTVFPNTPYALNFGNLFLTIIAVFILMWLLQKVFK